MDWFEPGQLLPYITSVNKRTTADSDGGTMTQDDVLPVALQDTDGRFIANSRRSEGSVRMRESDERILMGVRK